MITDDIDISKLQQLSLNLHIKIFNIMKQRASLKVTSKHKQITFDSDAEILAEITIVEEH